MKDIKWLEGNKIQIEPPKKTKKITGTRFATILGLNPWSTDFEIFCAVTKTYEVPFEDTVYTIAGKSIEPKQARYVENSYGMTITRPSDVWGEDYFRKTWGDFFPDSKHLGGMWDYLLKDENGNIEAVLEMKTTKRVEDWGDDIPEYYALQASLYAYLLGVDDVIMVASFLEEKDYENPGEYQPSINNTITVPFKVSERYPNFKEMVERVEKWWADHVETGISPEYDEKRDAEILKALRTNSLAPTTDIQELVKEAESLKAELDEVSDSISAKEKRLKDINEVIKKHAMGQFREGDKKVEVTGTNYVWTLSRSEKTDIDKTALEQDGLLDKYSKVSETYRMTITGGK